MTADHHTIIDEKVWNTERITKMWQRDMKWANITENVTNRLLTQVATGLQLVKQHVICEVQWSPKMRYACI